MISQADRLAAQSIEKSMGEMSQLHTQNLNRQVAEAVPMPVMAGAPGPTINGVARPFLGEDQLLLDRSAHVRRKGEKLLQFYARTGVSAHQLRTLSRGEVKHLVRLAEANEDMNRPEPRPSPIRTSKGKPFNITCECFETGLMDAHLRPRLPDHMIDTEDLKSLYDRLEAARS